MKLWLSSQPLKSGQKHKSIIYKSMSKLFFYDTETTGVKHWRNGIHQISGMIEIDGEIKDKFDFKVQPNPSCDIEQSALDVAKVTKEQIMSYPEMKIIFNELQKKLATYCDKFNKTDKFYLVGYNNTSFDNQFLRAWFTQNSSTPKDAEYGNYFGSWFWSDSHDAMVLASKKLMAIRPKMENFKLATVAKQLGIEVDETKTHDALYDIELTRQVYYKSL